MRAREADLQLCARVWRGCSKEGEGAAGWADYIEGFVLWRQPANHISKTNECEGVWLSCRWARGMVYLLDT